MAYCTYLTIYKGNKLPPFYIGSSLVSKVKNGYNGSVSSEKYKMIWRKEQRNSKHLFKTKIITYHQTRQDAITRENIFHIKLNVVKNKLYINMSNAIPNNKFGGRPKGYVVSSETRQKMSLAKTQEIKEKFSKLRKGLVPHKGKLIPKEDYWNSDTLREEKRAVRNLNVWDTRNERFIKINSKEYKENKDRYISQTKGKSFVLENGIRKLVDANYINENNLIKSGLDKNIFTVKELKTGNFIRIHKDDYNTELHCPTVKGRVYVIDLKSMEVKKIEFSGMDTTYYIEAPFWGRSRYCKNIIRLNDMYPLYDLWKKHKSLSTYKLENLRKEFYPEISYKFSERTITEFRNGYDPYQDDLLKKYIEANKSKN